MVQNNKITQIQNAVIFNGGLENEEQNSMVKSIKHKYF